MASPGRMYGAKLGPDHALDRIAISGVSSYAMASLNAGWCARFQATQTQDVISVRINWATVSAPGEITLRIETIDATTGKPTGTLYDANATIAFVPSAGWQTVTFASPPTTGLTVGTQYGVVMLTTTGGTTMTARGYTGADAYTSAYPIAVLTAADGTTRSNFAEVTGSVPICSLVMEDASEDPMGMCPYATSTTNNIFGTNAYALKAVTVGTVSAAGIEARISATGTPAGDLRVRIFDSGDNVVSNSTVTMDKDSLISGVASGRQIRAMFGGLASLAAGTYRVVFDSQSSANSSNCWRLISVIPASTGVDPSGYVLSSTTDVTAGPITWTDSATAEQAPVRIIVDDITTSGSGSANLFAGRF